MDLWIFYKGKNYKQVENIEQDENLTDDEKTLLSDYLNKENEIAE